MNISLAAAILFSLAVIIIVCEGNRFLINSSRSYAARKNHSSFKRMLWIIPGGLLYTASILALSASLHSYLLSGEWKPVVHSGSKIYINDQQVTIGPVGTAIFNAVPAFFTLLIIYELLYHFAKLRYTEHEKERLEKEKLKVELQQLKAIVNPHFLFNNLNSLSSLISESPQQAEIFLDELTKVFRYLLRNNDVELTTLESELQFIESYFHLLQTRYGAGIRLSVNIEPQHKNLLIPPLTLQLLMENVVKHNRVLKEDPLFIELYSAGGDKIVLRNDLRKKQGHIESTGIGLQSINGRYKLLNHPLPIVEQTVDSFSVIIFLVNEENPQRPNQKTQTAIKSVDNL